MPSDQLPWDAAVAAVRALEGRRVSVRIAHRHHDEELVVVAQGTLGTLTADAKQPSLFWPLGEPEPGHDERAGLYLRERDFEKAVMRAGGIVVIDQAGVVVNVRPLRPAA